MRQLPRCTNFWLSGDEFRVKSAGEKPRRDVRAQAHQFSAGANNGKSFVWRQYVTNNPSINWTACAKKVLTCGPERECLAWDFVEVSEETLRAAAESGFVAERLDEKALFALQVDDVLLAAT